MLCSHDAMTQEDIPEGLPTLYVLFAAAGATQSRFVTVLCPYIAIPLGWLVEDLLALLAACIA